MFCCTLNNKWQENHHLWKVYTDLYSGTWEILTLPLEEEMDNVDIITERKVLIWHGFLHSLSNHQILRTVLLQNKERTMSQLEAFDKRCTEHNPTFYFRMWLLDPFFMPTTSRALERMTHNFPKLHTECKRVCCTEGDIDCDSANFKSFAQRAQLWTSDFRHMFGGSEKFPCFGCASNSCCDICENEHPLVHCTGKRDSIGRIITCTSGKGLETGKESVLRWQTRCGNQLTQQSGLHVCNSCGLKYTVFRNAVPIHYFSPSNSLLMY